MDKNTSTPFFLFIGGSDHEGAVSKLKAAGFGYKKKLMESRVENWDTIVSLLSDDNLTGVLVKLRTHTYKLIANGRYAGAGERLFTALKKVPHIIFVHETCMFGTDDEEETGEGQQTDEEILSHDELTRLQAIYEPVPDEDDEWDWDDDLDRSAGRWNYHGHVFEPPSPDVRNHVNALLSKHDLNVVPYVKNAELTVMALAFIDQNEKNLIFRVYVPEGRIWAVESEKVLNLFRDYLSKVSGLNVRQDQYRTNKGTIYEFFGDHTLDPSTLPTEFNDFSDLLDLCITAPDSASKLLHDKSISANVVTEIVQRYAKEARRLHVDLKHERERKILSIRQRMESELVDVVPVEADWNSLTQLVDSLVPPIGGVSSALGFNTHGNTTPNIVAGTVNLNYKPQLFEKVEGFVAQEVLGTQNFGTEAADLIRLISEHGGLRKAELISAVHEIEDADAHNEDRLTAAKKLKTFMFKVGEKIGDVGLELLKTYIEKQFGL